MSDLIAKQKTITRAKLTKSKNNLESILNNEANYASLDDFIDEVKSCLSTFDTRLAEFESVENEYQLTLDDKDIEQAVTEYEDILSSNNIVKRRALRRLEKYREENIPFQPVEQLVDNLSICSNPSKLEVKLPKLELPKFGGEVIEYPSFWDRFQVSIHDTNIPEVQKFVYLDSLLYGEAKNTISGISITADNYKVACDLLEQRYGRKELIIFKHVQELLSINFQGKITYQNLRKHHDELKNHVRCLENHDIKGDQYGMFLTPIVLSTLPFDIRRDWSKESEGKETDFEFLLKFIEKEVRVRETSTALKPFTQEGTKSNEKPKLTSSRPNYHRNTNQRPNPQKASAVNLNSKTNPKVSKLNCNVCNKNNHTTNNCLELLTPILISERRKVITDKGLCIRCLSNEHSTNRCEFTCEKCNGSHHKHLCIAYVNKNSKSSDSKEKLASNKDSDRNDQEKTHSHTGYSSRHSKPGVILETIKVKLKLKESDSFIKATVMFDNGADNSYITCDLMSKVEGEYLGVTDLSVSAFGAEEPSQSELRNMYLVDVFGLKAGCGTIALTAVPTITTPILRGKLPEEVIDQVKTLDINSDLNSDEYLNIDVLIGSDCYWEHVMPVIRPISQSNTKNKLVALKTTFGWVLSGAYKNEKKGKGNSSATLLCINQSKSESLFSVTATDNDLQKMWDLELEKEEKFGDPILKKFNEEIKLKDNRYEIRLPWNENEKPKLMNNYQIATRKLSSLMKKLDKNPTLKEGYDKALNDMLDNGIIELVSESDVNTDNKVFYIPPRPVIKEDSLTTKIRITLNAACTGPNGVSLNHCMETGPNLIPELVGILIRFRRWPVVLVADVTKAFLQILVHPEDRDVHRFLREENGVIKTYRFCRLPFGNRSSPFVFNATVKYHLSQFEQSKVISELNENLYVDNWMTGGDEVSEVMQMKKEGTDVMKMAGMELAQFESNERVILDASELNESNVKILGMKWNPNLDCFLFFGIEVDPSLVITKRVVLSLIARQFDPMGFLNPFVIKLKILFQDLWRLGIDWDTEVPDEIATTVKSWIDDLSLLRNWRIQRQFFNGKWNDVISVTIHSFGDSSEKAFGACVYLELKTSTQSSFTFVLSKAKVCPLKRVTLPRLELLASVLAAQLAVVVAKALHIDPIYCKCWTDSTVVLNWIKSNPSKLKTFVANRCDRIHHLVPPSQWGLISGTLNPADLLTRGITATSLITDRTWLFGPSEIPTREDVEIEDLSAYEQETKKSVCMSTAHSNHDLILPIKKWSKYKKALLIVVYCMRFIQVVKNKSRRKDQLQLGNVDLKDVVDKIPKPSTQEFQNAEKILIRRIQEDSYTDEIELLRKSEQISPRSSIYKLSPFLDSEGFIRVGGRLDYAEMTYSEKHPILIPKGHLSYLIFDAEHKLLKHAGVNAMLVSVRNRFWVIGARRMAKRAKKECRYCQIVDSLAAEAPIAPLHPIRTKQQNPFTVTGLDHAGILYCADLPGTKLYILLFTCPIVRAIHLELVQSLNVKETVMAMKRFIARRGMPNEIWSDNHKTFVSLKDSMTHHFGSNSPTWKFVAPRSPWWGGYWERLVRTVKSALKKTIGLKTLTRSELETTIHEIEGVINSRPLTFVGDNIDDKSPLTPSHFLIGKSSVYEKENAQFSEQSLDLSERKFLKDDIMTKFWSMWSNEYLKNLPTWRGKNKYHSLKLNDVVLIQEDNTPRLLWIMGIITEVFTGRDGHIRACKIRTSKGELVRPIQRLHLLESDSDNIKPNTNLEEVCNDNSDSSQTNDQSPHDEGVDESISDTSPVLTLDNESETNKVSKFGRKIKPVHRYQSS